jgi:DNA repair exonuclease SbcCD ATPase subunit
MKLDRLYIAGFGNLQDFSYEFTDGINVLSAPNGWGKSTLAAFLRAMFYGLGDSRARSVAENARKRYTPWTGGSFGGSLELEANGKRYRIERFFGTKESEDTFTLFSLETGKESEDYTENIGEELFGIDADGFSRTVFMDVSAHAHGKVEKAVNNSISTKLNNLLQAENDLGNYEQAIDALVHRKRQYKTTGERGEIYAGERRLLELQRQIEVCQGQKAQAQELDIHLSGVGIVGFIHQNGRFLLQLLQHIQSPAASAAAQLIAAVGNVAKLRQHKLRNHELPFQKACPHNIQDAAVDDNGGIQNLARTHCGG